MLARHIYTDDERYWERVRDWEEKEGHNDNDSDNEQEDKQQHSNDAQRACHFAAVNLYHRLNPRALD